MLSIICKVTEKAMDILLIILTLDFQIMCDDDILQNNKILSS